MKGRTALLAVFVLASGCEKESPEVPELPPAPEEKVAVLNPVEEIGRRLSQGSPEEKQKALAAILELDEAARKQHK